MITLISHDKVHPMTAADLRVAQLGSLGLTSGCRVMKRD